MNEHGYAIDGNHYHISQVTIDEAGRWIPRPGAVPGPITRLSEFGEPPVLDEPAAGYLAAWRGGKAGTYATKVDVPETRGERHDVVVSVVVDGASVDTVAEKVDEPVYPTKVDARGNDDEGPLPFEEEDAPAIERGGGAASKKHRP